MRYPLWVFVGWFVVALIFSALTRYLLQDTGLDQTTRTAVTLAIALAVGFMFFYGVKRFRR